MTRTIKLLALSSALFLAGACNDESEEISPDVSDEVSLLVSTSIASNTYGVNALILESVKLQQNAQDNIGGRTAVCDYSESGEESAASPEGNPFVYSYNYAYNVSVNCSSIQIPTSISVDFTYNGSFDGPKLTWSHDGNGDFDISLDGQQNLVYSGTYDRAGSYNLKERENINGNSTVNITLSNLTIDPQTESIISGTGLYSIDVVRSDKEYTLSGTITFNGDGTATLDINGSSVTFNLITSQIS